MNPVIVTLTFANGATETVHGIRCVSLRKGRLWLDRHSYDLARIETMVAK